jgi:hypothetical protein
MPDTSSRSIGRVTRCSTRGFVGAVRIPEPEAPVFGAFCQAEAQQGASHVIGLVYNLIVEDDEFARQMAVAEHLDLEHVADHQANRQVPIEYEALAIGYQSKAGFHHTLPPQPPLTLAPIFLMSSQEVRAFTQELGFLSLILSAEHLPVDELLLASLRVAMQLRPPQERRPFLVQAGRQCARLMGAEITRLDRLLRSLAE